MVSGPRRLIAPSTTNPSCHTGTITREEFNYFLANCQPTALMSLVEQLEGRPMAELFSADHTAGSTHDNDRYDDEEEQWG